MQAPKNPTARRRITSILAQEILNNPDPKDFRIASEHQLCSRFAVSRVTIRLALGDLEHRGLIYRRHGKGTFAHGCSSRVYRSLGILIQSPDALKCTPLVEFVRGAQAVMTSLRSSLVLIGTSPLDWQAEMASTLGAVIVMEQNLTTDELNNLKNRNLPFTSIHESQLTLGDTDCFHLGLRIAEALNNAALTGEPVPALSLVAQAECQ
jgi:DNA-binding transcriptional regulator YhcF (GntR family)